MAGSRKHKNRNGRSNIAPSSAGGIDTLMALDGPPELFLTELLATQCRRANADAAVLLRFGAAGQVEIVAAYPPPGEHTARLGWIDRIEKPFRSVMQRGETVMVRQGDGSSGNDESQSVVMILPMENQGIVRAAAAFHIKAQNREALLLSRSCLETTSLLLDHRELQLTTKTHGETIHRLRRVLEVLDSVNLSTRFQEAGMALCNEIATRFDCHRVSLGILEGRCVHVRTMSHTDTVNREMQLMQAIERAMEECLDQDLEVIHPAEDTAKVASRATAILSESHGPSAVISLPVRRDGEVSAVMTLERRPEQPFAQIEEIETIRLICDLCAPRLLDLHLSDRWFGARIMSDLRRQTGRLLGHEHTWVKLLSAMLFMTGLFSATIKGEYRIKTPFTFKAQLQQAVVAPFDTFSKSVLVEPGDKVEGGKTLLGTLETTELRMKLAAYKAEQLGYRKQMTASMRDQKTADAQMASAQVDKVAAGLRMIETQIEQARLVAPISGWVVSEDRTQQIGAPVAAGEILFEIVRIDSLIAELHVPEAFIANISEGQAGTLASVGHPEKKIRFTIERINPIAEVVEHQNIFRCRARIEDHLEWMRPGMEGEARITAGRKTYLWMGTHRLVHWLRMKFWL